MLLAAGPLGHRAGARLRTDGPGSGLEDELPRLSSASRLSVAPGVIARMTLRNEQSVLPTPQNDADSARLLGRIVGKGGCGQIAPFCMFA